MARPSLIALLLPVVLLAGGCGESAPGSQASAGTAAPAVAPESDLPPPAGLEAPAADGLPQPPPPPLAEGAEIVYACGSTEMYVTYAGGEANVILYSGRVIRLVRTPDVGESYAGEGLVLRRFGNVVELVQDGGEPARCEESGGNA